MKNMETYKNEVALFRYNIIAPLVTTPENFESDQAFFENASKEKYRFQGEFVKISASTIERWYYKFKKNGLESLKPQRRSDLGKMRKIDCDIIDYVTNEIIKYPRIPSTQLHADLKNKGITDLSLSSVNRLALKIRKNKSLEINDEMLRYERAHINEVWCGDSTVIRSDSLEQKPTKLYVIALIDDASRKIVGAHAFRNDNAINLMIVLKEAILKSGIPNVFNFDNGKNYKCKQMEIIAAKLSSRIHYCAPYTPTAKAKIERWFRTLKDHWNCGGLKTLEEINQSLTSYVNAYNNTIHSSLVGKSPVDRFNLELKLIRYLKEEKINSAFLFEIERKVSADCVVKVEKIDFEVNYKYQNQRVWILYEPDLSRAYLKDGEELIEIFRLNKVGNSKVKRKKLQDIIKEGNK